MAELGLILTGQSASLASRQHAGPAGSTGSLAIASTGGLPLLARSLPLTGPVAGLMALRMQAAARLAQQGGRSGSSHPASALAAQFDASAVRALSRTLNAACSTSAATDAAAFDAVGSAKVFAALEGARGTSPPETSASWRAASAVARAAAKASAEAARRAHARVAALRAEPAQTEGAHAAAPPTAAPAPAVGNASLRAAAMAATAAAATATARSGKLKAPADILGDRTDTSTASSDAGSSESDGTPVPTRQRDQQEGEKGEGQKDGQPSPRVPRRCADLYAHLHADPGASLSASLPCGALTVGATSLSLSLPVRGASRMHGGSLGGSSRVGCVSNLPEACGPACESGREEQSGDDLIQSADATVRALMRVREKKKAERAAAEAAAAAAAPGEEVLLARAAMAEQKEEKEVERAQIYAINKLVAKHHEARFAALSRSRGVEVKAAVERQGAGASREAGARREVTAAAAAHERIKSCAVEGSRELRELPIGEPEASVPTRGAERQAAARVEERRERRAQVNAVSEQLAGGEAYVSRFGTATPGGPVEADPIPAVGPATPPRAAAAVRQLYGGLLDRQGADAVAALSPCKLSRRKDWRGWSGAASEAEQGRAPSLLAPSAARSVSPSGEAVARAAADAAARRVLTVAAAQKIASRSREAVTAHRRETAREKGEEKEIFRARVYALNKLMRGREEESFRRFKARLEAASAARGEGAS